MSLPPAQQRTLRKIEGRLRDSDPLLSSRFVIFTQLARDEAMPWIEQIRPRPVADRFVPVVTFTRWLFRRPAARVRAMLLLPAALTAMMCALAIAAGFPGNHRGAAVPKAPAAKELVVKPRICRLGLVHAPALGC